MDEIPTSFSKNSVLISLAQNDEQAVHARWMIESLRTFGGESKNTPVWIYVPENSGFDRYFAQFRNVQVLPLQIPKELLDYYFASKVAACAQAEADVSSAIRTLIWVNPEAYFFQAPALLDTSPNFQAVFRPVHISNIGSMADQPLDPFWQSIYQAVGLKEANFFIESFIDIRRLRPYFNTHVFAVAPSSGILRLWLEYFIRLVSDSDFQRTACREQLNRIFLHQAILSALVGKLIPPAKIRHLPDTYSYPLALHSQVPETRRISRLDRIVCAVYEDNDTHPLKIQGLDISEPIQSWLMNQLTAPMP